MQGAIINDSFEVLEFSYLLDGIFHDSVIKRTLSFQEKGRD